MVAAHSVDTTRIYVTGHSYGCVMAQRVLAKASDLVAAVACFSGALTLANDLGVFPLTELSSEYTPRPLMVIHGNTDTVVPYDSASTFSALRHRVESSKPNLRHRPAPAACTLRLDTSCIVPTVSQAEMTPRTFSFHCVVDEWKPRRRRSSHPSPGFDYPASRL